MRSVIGIGNFDGLHLGHRKLLGELLSIAKKRDLHPVIITYDNHPAQTLHRRIHPFLLLPPTQKIRQLEQLGIGEVRMLHFDEVLSRTSAEDFLREYMVNPYHPAVIVMGYDSSFGWQRQGNYSFLQQHQEQYGYELHFVEPVQYQGSVVSSSLIRERLALGELEEANSLLAGPYTLYGKVTNGSGIGRELGFPTANLELDSPYQMVPRSGVYLSRVMLAHGRFFALTNIGCSPTLKHSGVTEIESYILDFGDQIYGSHISVELMRYIREEKVFANASELQDAIRNDLAIARGLVERLPQ
jgi:riboflavin kinase/FMN adenylyltransferase